MEGVKEASGSKGVQEASCESAPHLASPNSMDCAERMDCADSSPPARWTAAKVAITRLE